MMFYKKLYVFIIPLAVSQAEGLSALPLDINQFENMKEAVQLEELDEVRGRGGIVNMTTIVNSNIDAELSNNTANNNVTGFNVIDNGAFTEASGIFSIIQNTGNNVIIQDSTIVNVTIIP